MTHRSLNEIMGIAAQALVRGVPPDEHEARLSPHEQVLWEKEARLRWRLTRPLESVHGPRRRRRGGWKSPLARGL